MLARAKMGAGARLVAVVFVVCLGAGATLARPAPSAETAVTAVIAKPASLDVPIALPPTPLHLTSLEPAERTAPAPTPIAPQGPFGLTTRKAGPYYARWHMLQPLIRLERTIMAQCRTHAGPCPAAAAKFNAIVDAARARSGLARIGQLNRAINLAITARSDMAQYGAPDVWATPLMTFRAGAGDCEDYAIAKYVALGEAGVPAADRRLVLVHDTVVNQGHMVAAARVDGRWLILDNRTMRLVADKDVATLTPLAALGGATDAPTLAAASPAVPAAPADEARNTAGLAILL